MLLKHLEQMFEEICRTLISFLVSSGQRQFKRTTGEYKAERKSSEEFRLPCCKVNSELWASSAGCRLVTLTQNKGTCPALPCPAHGTGKAQQHMVKSKLENLPREVVDKLCLSLYLKTAHTITIFQISLFFSGPAN